MKTPFGRFHHLKRPPGVLESRPFGPRCCSRLRRSLVANLGPSGLDSPPPKPLRTFMLGYIYFNSFISKENIIIKKLFQNYMQINLCTYATLVSIASCNINPQ